MIGVHDHFRSRRHGFFFLTLATSSSRHHREWGVRDRRRQGVGVGVRAGSAG